MKKLLTILILILSMPTFAQTAKYHSASGKMYELHYDTAKGKAYYFRNVNTRFYFSKRMTKKMVNCK